MCPLVWNLDVLSHQKIDMWFSLNLLIWETMKATKAHLERSCLDGSYRAQEAAHWAAGPDPSLWSLPDLMLLLDMVSVHLPLCRHCSSSLHTSLRPHCNPTGSSMTVSLEEEMPKSFFKNLLHRTKGKCVSMCHFKNLRLRQVTQSWEAPSSLRKWKVDRPQPHPQGAPERLWSKPLWKAVRPPSVTVQLRHSDLFLEIWSLLFTTELGNFIYSC